LAIPAIDTLTDATGGVLITDEVAAEINKLVHDESVVDYFARHWPMKSSRKVIRRQLTSVSPEAVDEKGVKPKDAQTFTKVTLIAETIAVIVPFTEEEVEDADIDTISFVKEDVVQALAEKYDAFTLGYDVGTPFTSSWSGNVPAANTIAYGTSPAADLADDLNEAISAIEVNGYECTGMAAHPRVKALLRGLRDANNNPIFVENLRDNFRDYSVYGVPIRFTRQVVASGSPTASEILLAYTPYLYVGDRIGIQVKLLDQATLIADNPSDEDIHLGIQDMIALRFRMRKAFEVKLDDVLSKVTGVPH